MQFARSENLDAVREFRRVSDESPNDPLASGGAAPRGRRVRRSVEAARAGSDVRHDGPRGVQRAGEPVSGHAGGRAGTEEDRRRSRRNSRLKQYKAALYYLRYKAYDSAILYLKDLVATYPRASIAPEALLRLIGAYQRLGYKEDVRETCGYLRRFHAQAPGVSEACPAEPGAS